MVTTSNVIFTKEGVQVTLGSTRIKENLTKSISKIPQPKSTEKQSIIESTTPPKIVDILLRSEQMWSLTGELCTGLGTGDTHSDAADKRDDLRKIFQAGGVFVVTIEGTNFNCNSDKCEFDWIANDEDTITTYRVMITVVRGEDI